MTTVSSGRQLSRVAQLVGLALGLRLSSPFWFECGGCERTRFGRAFYVEDNEQVTGRCSLRCAFRRQRNRERLDHNERLAVLLREKRITFDQYQLLRKNAPDD